jgi:hypothetical protein
MKKIVVPGPEIEVVNMMEKGKMITSKSTHFGTFKSMAAQILVRRRFKKTEEVNATEPKMHII